MNDKIIASELVRIAKSIKAIREDYPEEMIYDEVTIKLKLDTTTGNYMVVCRDWKTEFSGGKNPSNAVSKLINDIVKHNEENNQKLKLTYEYIDKVIEKIETSNLVISGWKADFESEMGGDFIIWTNPKSKYTVYATPFWEQENIIPVEVTDPDSGDMVMIDKVKFESSGDIDADVKNYLSEMKKVWGKIASKIKELEK